MLEIVGKKITRASISFFSQVLMNTHALPFLSHAAALDVKAPDTQELLHCLLRSRVGRRSGAVHQKDPTRALCIHLLLRLNPDYLVLSSRLEHPTRHTLCKCLHKRSRNV